MSASKNVVVEVPSCPICAEAYTTVVRKRVECNSCHKDVCTKCIERYMLSNIEDPHCIHCRNSWNRAFLSTVCTNTFLNKTYYAYRQTILVNREKSFLPSYQLAAEREVRVRTLLKEDYALYEEYAAIEKQKNEALYALSTKRTMVHRRISNVRAGRDELGETSSGTKAVATKFVRRCTATNCNGFLSSVWKCGICQVWVCPDCFEVKGVDKDSPHTCTAAGLATAALIRKDTKPCPTCGEMISKIDGCDQMFCTSCHKPFSWVTGQAITTGTIHNPHYFQWLAKGGLPPQNPGFIPCGGLPNAYHVQRALVNAITEDRKDFLQILRMCVHISDVERVRFERHLDPLNNEDVGVLYLLKEKDEDAWKLTLAKREKDRQKSNEIRDILDAFNGAAIDLFRRIDTGIVYSKEDATKLILEVRIELEALRQFIFKSMTDVSRSFNCSVPLLDEKWCMEHGKVSDIARKKKHAEEAKAAKAAVIAATAAAIIATATTDATAATAATAAVEETVTVE